MTTWHRIACVVSFVHYVTCATFHPEIIAERHSIVKRFSDAGSHVFTSHDIAEVTFEHSPGNHRRISRRDLSTVLNDADNPTHKVVHAQLSSGQTMTLNLKKRSLFGPNTLFADHTSEGLVKRDDPPDDCYATGHVHIDGQQVGTAAAALCDGLHGSVTTEDTEYYLHPVTHSSGEHLVHVLSHPKSGYSHETSYAHVLNQGPGPEGADVDHFIHDNEGQFIVDDENGDVMNEDDVMNEEDVFMDDDDVFMDEDDVTMHEHEFSQRKKRDIARSKRNNEAYLTATGFVVELAVFNDKKYLERIESMIPSRVDEYIIMSFAGVAAMYGDKEKVGYEATFKIKLYQNWFSDPSEYHFEEDLFNNLREFCVYTREAFPGYDMHYLNTGITQQKGHAAGVAYFRGVCKSVKCGTSYIIAPNRAYLIAHEIGHNLGFGHHSSASCPADIKAQGPGFMGSGGMKFSACNKWELHKTFSMGEGQCLFEETSPVQLPDNDQWYQNLPKVLPGQYFKSPSEWCRAIYGKDYIVYRPFDLRGEGECVLSMCINDNKENPEYGVIKVKNAYPGHPCGDEMFCNNRQCYPWEHNTQIYWDVDFLKEHKQETVWSEWSSTWSECTSECGTGVQIKRRECLNTGDLLNSPYCRGVSVKSRPCNQQACPQTQKTDAQLRQEAGNEICTRLLDNEVSLPVSTDSVYTSVSKNIYIWSYFKKFLMTKSCFLQCERVPTKWNYLDSLYPDGTPCTESDKNDYQRKKYNIHLRCVHGVCTEISDCPDNARKDRCGVCASDVPSSCVSFTVNQSQDVPEGERLELAIIPAGTKAVAVDMIWWEQKGARLELWDTDGTVVLASSGGLNGNRKNIAAFNYAGTSWMYNHGGYIRTDGPTDRALVLKALRASHPLKRIQVSYLPPP